MEVGCLATVAMAPGSSLYCSGPEPAGGDGCGVSGVATEREIKLEHLTALGSALSCATFRSKQSKGSVAFVFAARQPRHTAQLDALKNHNNKHQVRGATGNLIYTGHFFGQLRSFQPEFPSGRPMWWGWWSRLSCVFAEGKVRYV